MELKLTKDRRMDRESVSVPDQDADEIRRCSRLFWRITLIFAALWIVFPTIFFPNYRLDIVEQFFVGREWTPGSGSHPALTAIALDIVSTLTGRSPAAPYITAALFHLLALTSIWLLAREYLSPRLALIAVFSMFCYWYLFQMEGTRFNNSVTLDAFWILGIWTGFKAFQKERIPWWIGTGIVLGVGLYMKYTEIILALIFVVFLLTCREKRWLWRTPGPWLTMMTALAVFLPYVYWLMGSGFFQSMAYAVGNAPHETGIWGHFVCPLEFLSNQLPLLLPPVLCLIPVCGWLGRPDPAYQREKWENRFLTFVLFGPLLFNLIWSAFGGVFLRCDLGCHLWLPLTIYLLVRLKADESPRAVWRGIFVSLTVDLFLLVAVCVGVTAAPLWGKHLPRYHFPGQAVAEGVEKAWRDRYATALPWACGESWTRSGDVYEAWPWLAGNVAAYGHDRARVYSGPRHCSWATAADVRRDGGVFLWTPGDHDETILETLRRDFSNAEILPTMTFRPKTPLAHEEVRVGIALIPPSGTDSSAVCP